jgi:hypothetical protein
VQERADKTEQPKESSRQGQDGRSVAMPMSTTRASREGITQSECVRGEGAF